MAYTDLREFISALERAGELRRVAREVDPILEITEITDRVSKQGGPALLFERVNGSSMPVLINAFGSPTRMNLALQVASPGDLAAELQDVLDLKAPEGLLGKLRMLPKLQDLASAFPKLVKDGPCKQVVVRDNPSLAGIPVLWKTATWPPQSRPSRSETSNSSWTTPAACPSTAPRWAWTPRASGPRRASPAPGPTRS